MRFNTLITTTLCVFAAGIYSCSPKLTPPTQPQALSISLPQDIDQLLPQHELAFSTFKSEPVEFFTPGISITETFNNFEKNQIRAKDEKLFGKRNELMLDLGQIPESAFSFPLPEARVISPYGNRRGRKHTGVDLKTFANDTVRAAFDGIIRVANRGRGYGNVIVIRHYNGLETVYSHNSKNFVKSGDRVTAGMPIALTGRTGRATTEHVHFETRINGQCFDPNLIIDFQARKLQNNCIVFTPDTKGSILIDKV